MYGTKEIPRVLDNRLKAKISDLYPEFKKSLGR